MQMIKRESIGLVNLYAQVVKGLVQLRPMTYLHVCYLWLVNAKVQFLLHGQCILPSP
jgi:hypothetical protein